MALSHGGNGQLEDGKPRLSEDDITRTLLGPRGVPGKPDTAKMTPQQQKNFPKYADPGHTCLARGDANVCGLHRGNHRVRTVHPHYLKCGSSLFAGTNPDRMRNADPARNSFGLRHRRWAANHFLNAEWCCKFLETERS